MKQLSKEDKQLLLKDLCTRLPYGVKVQDELGRVNKLVIGNADLIRLFYNDFSMYGENALSFPLLRPMSSMTEKEREEVEDLNMNPFSGSVTDWLLEHHFDFRGLLEKGLALEAPADMYKVK